MITQALSYSPVDRATLSQPRTGKGGLRPIDFLRLIDAARLMLSNALRRIAFDSYDLLGEIHGPRGPDLKGVHPGVRL